MIILDASILAKWFLKEQDSELALDFKEQLTKDKLDAPLVTADKRILQQAEPFAKIQVLGSK